MGNQAYNHPILGSVTFNGTDNNNQNTNVATVGLTGIETAGIAVAAYAAAVALWEGVSRFLKSRLINKKVVAVTSAGRRFEGVMCSHSTFMNTITILDSDGEKHTLRWGSINILCTKESSEEMGAYEELREKLVVGKITKEEYSKLRSEVKSSVAESLRTAQEEKAAAVKTGRKGAK